MRGLIDVVKHDEIKYKPFEPYSSRCQTGYIFSSKEIKKLGYSPYNEFLGKLVDVALENKFEKYSFENEDALNEWIRNQSANEPVAGIHFDSIESVSNY